MLTLLLVSCSNKEEELSANSFPPYHYSYCLSFSDEKGNDLLEGIKTGVDDTGKPTVNPTIYTLEVVKPEDSKEEFWPLSPLALWNSEECRFLLISVTMKDWYNHEKPEVITVNLACHHIFGDSEKHQLVSYWKFEDGNPNSEAVLLRVTIDGVDASIPEPKKYNSYVFATLTK